MNFIVDFACLELKLIIEVDGYSHFLDETIEKDRIKDEVLKESGFILIRFTDSQVLKDMGNVILEIESVVDIIETGGKT